MMTIVYIATDQQLEGWQLIPGYEIFVLKAYNMYSRKYPSVSCSSI